MLAIKKEFASPERLIVLLVQVESVKSKMRRIRMKRILRIFE